MKGLQEKTDGDGIFLVIKHGGIVQESKNPREGFVPIKVTNPRSGDETVKYVKRYKGVEALIKKIEWYDREYEGTPFQGWKLLLDADGVPCSMDLPFESRVGTRFMKLAENIDYSIPVELSAWKGSDDKIALSVKQNGEKVPQNYTRDNPGDCPPPVQGFNKKWNFDAQKEFLHKRMIEVVIPKVIEVHGIATSNGSNGHAPEQSAEPAAKTEKPLEQILKEIQTSLKDFSEEKDVSVKESMEQWFGTRVWAEVEKMEPDFLKTTLKKIDDEMLPF